MVKNGRPVSIFLEDTGFKSGRKKLSLTFIPIMNLMATDVVPI